ncbi:hypothetical protein [Streptomyces axinellae]|uniref:Uncharacterized protein n=1 Tax=Streptomyces axinellae TaxID=552788 RepID=A0ABP6C7A6_9ACTN
MDKGESSIPDEDWERFLRGAGAGGDDVPKEPSARARMVTRRLREKPGRPEGWRAHRPPRPRGIRGWYAVALVAAGVTLVVTLAGAWPAGWFGGGDAGSAPLSAESGPPDRAPATEAAAERPTLDEPFRGSPAARWADGREGIHLPAPRATGWMSEAQTAKALDRSRDFLAASGLDPRVLRGERPRAAIALINPHQRDVQSYVKKAFDAPGRKNDPLLLFSRFAPGKARLVGDVVKTRGRITYREGERGALEVTADVTYVYPVTRPDADSGEVVRTIVRREIVLSWDDPAKVRTGPGTFSLVSYKTDTTNGGCGPRSGYFVPEFGAGRAAEGSRGGTRVDPYDRSTSVRAGTQEAAEAGCGTATRS